MRKPHRCEWIMKDRGKKKNNHGVVVAVTTREDLIATRCSNFASSFIVSASKHGAIQRVYEEKRSSNFKRKTRSKIAKWNNYPCCNFPVPSLLWVSDAAESVCSIGTPRGVERKKQCQGHRGLLNRQYNSVVYSLWIEGLWYDYWPSTRQAIVAGIGPRLPGCIGLWF